MKSPSVGDVTLVHRSIECGGRDWVIWSATDESQLLALGEQRTPFPFGLLLWESAIALATSLAACPSHVEGRRVLELGCGVGLAGIVASSLGGIVTAIDHDAAAIEVARTNAAANGCDGIMFEVADWTTFGSAGAFDLVIGADVTYEKATHRAVLDTISRLLAPNGRALFADPSREDQAAFMMAARDVGFEISRHAHAVPDLVRAGAVVDVTVMGLSRAEAGMA